MSEPIDEPIDIGIPDMPKLPTLITETDTDDKFSKSKAFEFFRAGGRYLVSGMKDVTVTEGYSNESAKIVIYAPTDPSSNDSAWAFVVDSGCNVPTDVTIASTTSSQSYTILASGSCDLIIGEDSTKRNISNLKLELKSNHKIQFTNDNIVNITGTTNADTVYIERYGATNGVSATATLDFSTGGDTIYFNGATTVKNISGGGSRGYTYSSA